MNIKTINSERARKSFSDLLDKSGFGGERIVVTRKGKAVAALVSLDDLKTIQSLEDQKDISEAERVLSDPESVFISWEKAKKDLATGQ